MFGYIYFYQNVQVLYESNYKDENTVQLPLCYVKNSLITLAWKQAI